MENRVRYLSIFFHDTPTTNVSIPQHSIFTTICVEWGQLLLWSWHQERLIHDVSLLGGRWDKTRVSFLEQLAKDLGKGALRITCTKSDWWVHTWIPHIDEDVALSSVWLSWEHKAPLPPFSKHGYRSKAHVVQQQQDVDVLLWHDSYGTALEASFGNIFIIRGEHVYTPPLDGRILPGIGRRWLTHIVRQLGMDFVEKQLSFRESGWWLCSSLRCMQRLDISSILSNPEKELRDAVQNKRAMLEI